MGPKSLGFFFVKRPLNFFPFLLLTGRSKPSSCNGNLSSNFLGFLLPLFSAALSWALEKLGLRTTSVGREWENSHRLQQVHRKAVRNLWNFTLIDPFHNFKLQLTQEISITRTQRRCFIKIQHIVIFFIEICWRCFRFLNTLD